MKRSHTCGALRAAETGHTVVLEGWVHRLRDLGGLVFLDLRDRYGLTQVVFEPERGELQQQAHKLHAEYVVRIRGTVRQRPATQHNKAMPTGQIEVEALELEVLNACGVLPFTIADPDSANDDLRLKYRYLDLRRPEQARFLLVRHRMMKAIRAAFEAQDFIEVETPVLMKSTPEGARDYLVPSRVHHGSFYALPQSPQTYKQLLMLAGFDRYFQIVKCFRDEDLRSDRQPEFTQIDIEMSFVDEEDIFTVGERMMAHLFREVLGQELSLPLPRMSWQESMDRYGNDKPDRRFAMEIVDLSAQAAGSGFQVLDGALAAGGVVRGIVLAGQAEALSRKKQDELQDYVRHLGGKGVVVVRWTAEGITSPMEKATGPEFIRALLAAAGAGQGDVLLIGAGPFREVCKVLGALRLRLAREYNLIDTSRHELLWVTSFPMFEIDDEGNLAAAHHPFTQPDPAGLAAGLPLDQLKSRAYDMVMDGNELGSGSVRIHSEEMQSRVFDLLKISREEAQHKFGFLLEAFRYGAPPHAGFAFGLDRLVMLFAGTENIRDVIAFPKTTSASSPMDGAPSRVDERQLTELGIRLIETPRSGA
jgi:aspartyl-tRNA synthetase